VKVRERRVLLDSPLSFLAKENCVFIRPRLTRQSGIGTIAAVWVLGVIVLTAVAALFIHARYYSQVLEFNTPYQAVLLSSGNVYFGKLQNYGSKFPVLTDVFYVQTSVNPESKQTSNVLVKRGRELHAPDRMYLNPSQIVLVEPVGPESKIGQLIAEQKRQQ
jgi:hypothetical protein